MAEFGRKNQINARFPWASTNNHQAPGDKRSLQSFPKVALPRNSRLFSGSMRKRFAAMCGEGLFRIFEFN